jgi:hypothetical protein
MLSDGQGLASYSYRLFVEDNTDISVRHIRQLHITTNSGQDEHTTDTSGKVRGRSQDEGQRCPRSYFSVYKSQGFTNEESGKFGSKMSVFFAHVSRLPLPNQIQRAITYLQNPRFHIPKVSSTTGRNSFRTPSKPLIRWTKLLGMV